MCENDMDEWFVTEILPIEALLVRYLKRNWKNHDEITDLRQEVYVRVFEAALKINRAMSNLSFFQ